MVEPDVDLNPEEVDEHPLKASLERVKRKYDAIVAADHYEKTAIATGVEIANFRQEFVAKYGSEALGLVDEYNRSMQEIRDNGDIALATAKEKVKQAVVTWGGDITSETYLFKFVPGRRTITIANAEKFARNHGLLEVLRKQAITTGAPYIMIKPRND